MSEFAFSGVGLNPHFPVLANPATLGLDPTPRIPGGSTSGGAASVAAGAAWAALGSDTGGSIRIPAALQGLVGFKSTARLVPIDGAVPLAPTLDTVSAMTRSVRDAVVAARSPRRPDACSCRSARSRSGASRCRPGSCSTASTRPSRAPSSAAWRRSRPPARGSRRSTLAPLAEIAPINANGSFAAAESWAFHRRWLVEREAEYDPRVALRIRRGETMSAADYIDLVAARRDWIARMERRIAGLRRPALAHRADRRAAARAAGRRRRGVLRRQQPSAAQSEQRQLPRRLRPQPALPARRRAAGRADGLARRRARRRRPRRRPRDRGRARRRPHRSALRD